LIQGSHLVLESRLSDSCYYLESPEDGRPVFALPWHGRTLLGTTETPYQGDPAMARCLPGEEAYLLATLSHYFPHYGASAQVIDRMAGLRVLPGGGPLASRPRDVMIQRDVRDGAAYVGVCGGKLTGYRSTAARVADILARHLGRRRQLADTATLRLPEP